MSITNENVQKFKDYGLVLTPVHKSKDPEQDKKPKSAFLGNYVNGKPKFEWKFDWTDDDLLEANRIGAYHKQSNIFDVDFDDKDFIAHKFSSLLPAPTLTIGKKVNGRIETTHLIYRTDLKKVKDFKKAQPIIEVLGNTQTIIAGVDREVINNVEPMLANPDDIKAECKLIATFTELYKHWPKKGLKKRNEAYFKLGGAFTETDVPMHLRLKYVRKFCELTDDEDQVDNRLSCIERQQEKFDEGGEAAEDVTGIGTLGFYLNANLKQFDLIKREEVKEETNLAQGLTFLNGFDFTIKDFPKPEYILWPVVAKNQIRQVFAKAGTGKTLYCLFEACAIASGYDFMHFKNKEGKTSPVLYVEGEMDSSSIQDRLNDVEAAYERENKKLLKENLFFATLAIQKDMFFHSLTKDIGRENIEITARKIEELRGKKPVIYLDNITALTVMQEKEGAEWVELMQWLSRLRNKGYHVTFLHHPTKIGVTASGSNIKERSIDIDMKLTTPDEKTSVEEFDQDGHTQMIIEFLKWREHMNTWHSRPRIAVISRAIGRWSIWPMLTKVQRTILSDLKRGLDAHQIIAEHKKEAGFSKANVYKTIRLLVQENVIKNEGHIKVKKEDNK